MYLQVWFDSSTERALATILDDADDIEFWVRLATGDPPILWQSDGREYNPDFIAVDASGVHWLIESKMDKELEIFDVKGKESAALRWASHVSTALRTCPKQRIATSRARCQPARVRATTDHLDRRVVLSDEAIDHIGRSHPEMLAYLDQILSAVERPTVHRPGRAANEEWHLLEAAGPSSWLHVVVHFVGFEGSVTTAFGRRRLL